MTKEAQQTGVSSSTFDGHVWLECPWRVNMNTKNIEEERGIGTELRKISKDWIWDNNVEKPTISKNDLERFKCSELLVDHSAINFRSLFKAKQAAKALNGWNKFEKNYVVCIHEKLRKLRELRKKVRQIRDKNIKK